MGGGRGFSAWAITILTKADRANARRVVERGTGWSGGKEKKRDVQRGRGPSGVF